MAGQYLISDPVEKGLLPQGQFDVPLTISDAMFAANGALGFDDASTRACGATSSWSTASPGRS